MPKEQSIEQPQTPPSTLDALEQLVVDQEQKKKDSLAELERIQKEQEEAEAAAAKKQADKISGLAKNVVDMVQGNKRLNDNVNEHNKHQPNYTEGLYDDESARKLNIIGELTSDIKKLKEKTVLIADKIKKVEEKVPPSEVRDQAIANAIEEIFGLQKQVEEKTEKTKQLNAEIEEHQEKLKEIEAEQLKNSKDPKAFAMENVKEAKKMEGEPLSEEEEKSLGKAVDNEERTRREKIMAEREKKEDTEMAVEAMVAIDEQLKDTQKFKKDFEERFRKTTSLLDNSIDGSNPEAQKFMTEMSVAMRKADKLTTETFIFNSEKRKEKAQKEADEIREPFVKKIIEIKKAVEDIEVDIERYINNSGQNNMIKGEMSGGSARYDYPFNVSFTKIEKYQQPIHDIKLSAEIEEKRKVVMQRIKGVGEYINFAEIYKEINSLLENLGYRVEKKGGITNMSRMASKISLRR